MLVLLWGPVQAVSADEDLDRLIQQRTAAKAKMEALQKGLGMKPRDPVMAKPPISMEDIEEVLNPEAEAEPRTPAFEVLQLPEVLNPYLHSFQLEISPEQDLSHLSPYTQSRTAQKLFRIMKDEYVVNNFLSAIKRIDWKIAMLANLIALIFYLVLLSWSTRDVQGFFGRTFRSLLCSVVYFLISTILLPLMLGGQPYYRFLSRCYQLAEYYFIKMA